MWRNEYERNSENCIYRYHVQMREYEEEMDVSMEIRTLDNDPSKCVPIFSFVTFCTYQHSGMVESKATRRLRGMRENVRKMSKQTWLHERPDEDVLRGDECVINGDQNAR